MKPYDVKRAIELHENGYSLRKIGEMIGVSRTTVLNNFKKANYKNRDPNDLKGRGIINKVGVKYGKLTVVGFHSRVKKQTRWNCLCECGKASVVIGSCLTSGVTKSCGCLKSKHNMARTSEYRAWASMIQRCDNEKSTGYKNYGLRGISYSGPWSNFENFYADMGKRPTNTHTLDRINNDGDYCKKNCRWATRKVQNNNRRSNVKVTINGDTKNVSQWAEHYKISPLTIYRRVRSGKSMVDAITAPVKYRKRSK